MIEEDAEEEFDETRKAGGACHHSVLIKSKHDAKKSTDTSEAGSHPWLSVEGIYI